MDKMPFEITAKQEGKRALVRITGEIGWEANANDFRQAVDALIADGCTEAHIYINSPGGSCFDAAEIVNILSVFGGNLTGEGGALVASAATYISAQCKTFEMPENGQFMVHRPRGLVGGNVNDLRAYLKLLEDVEKDYFDTFSGLAKNKADFKNKWEAGDNWMTAKEAKECGFITGVRERVKIDRETAAMIRACMNEKQSTYFLNNYNSEKMDFIKTTALTLGLPDNATEEQIKAEIEKGKKAVADLAALKKAQAEKEAADKADRVKAAIDKAIADKRIKADARGDWEEMLNANLEKGLKALEAIAPVTSLSKGLTQNRDTTTGKVTHNGKTFEELQEEDPDALGALMENNAEAYDALYENYLKRNKLK